MSEQPHNGDSPRSIKLEDLIALNDEIASLVRAGIPLELGLREVGGDIRGSLGRLAATLGSRMSRGESLTQAMEAERDHFPKMYRAVVEAGVRAGRLPAALEAVTNYAKTLLEVHRRVTLSCAYPLLVFALAYTLFLVLLDEMVPRFDAFLVDARIPLGRGMRLLTIISETMPYWSPVIPLLVVGTVVYWALFQKRAVMQTGRSLTLFRFIPWAGSIYRDLQLANFTGLLGLLTEQRVPLPTAILLAADSTGQTAMIRAAEETALRLRAGHSLSESIQDAAAFPPYLRWLMQSSEQLGTLSESLNRSAEIYQARAMQRLESLKLSLPLLAVAVIGGGATLIYAFTLFTPLVESLRGLAVP